ncbi:MAG: NUDIX domain-containing protein [Gemmatimonadetes bacterium]|nr:NUDIX domain-containing protein [Gemmatimonadota bacterium]
MGGSVLPVIEEREVEEIVLAAVVDEKRRVLIQPRVGDPAFAGSWELPGGKIDPGEDHAAALVREVEEETGIGVRVGSLVVALCHAYPDRRIALYAYLCHPVGTAKPPRWTRWARPSEYRAMPMPEANGPIVEAIERAIGVLDRDSSISYR